MVSSSGDLRMKGQHSLLAVAILFIAILGTIFTVVNIVDSGEMDMTYQINASVSDFQYQEDNWLTQNRDYENMIETNQQELSPVRNTAGFWISEPVNTTENYGVPQGLEYSADMSDGEGTITVRSFDQEPTGNAEATTIDFQAEEENSENIAYVNGGIEVS